MGGGERRGDDEERSHIYEQVVSIFFFFFFFFYDTSITHIHNTHRLNFWKVGGWFPMILALNIHKAFKGG